MTENDDDALASHRCCTKGFFKCCKCFSKILRLPCCIAKLMISLVCFSLVLAVVLAAYYEIDVIKLYWNVKEYVDPWLAKHENETNVREDRDFFVFK